MAFASGAHSSTMINNSQAAPTFWLASAAPMGVKYSRRKLWKSPDQFREEQPPLLKVTTLRNKGHLALIRQIRLMSKAPETTFPPHLACRGKSSPK